MRPILILAAIGLFIWLGVGGIAALARATQSQDRVFGTPSLVSMAFVDALTGWAVAADCSTPSASSASSACESQIYATTDGGQSWSPQSRVLLTPRGLSFANRASGWLVGSIGQRCGSNPCQNVIMLSDDGGKKWNRVSSVSAELSDVAATSTNDAWAVGQACPQGHACSGALVHTTSGGQLWDSSNLPVDGSELKTGRLASGFGWVTAAGGSPGRTPLVVTSNGGATWTALSVPCPTAGVLASFSTDQSGLLACQMPLSDPSAFAIYRTRDGGTSWLLESSPASIPGLVRPPTPTIVLGGATGGASDKADVVRSLQLTASGDAWLALANGNLLSLSTQGAASVRLATDEGLRQVTFIDSQHGWLLGSRSIWSTSDGGASWIKHSIVSGPLR